MAKLTGALKLIGTIDDLNIYKMKGSKEYIVRTKPGPTREKVKKSPEFELTRANNSTFGGGSKFSKEIRLAAGGELTRLMYSYIHGELTALGNDLAKAIPSDQTKGREPIRISKAFQWLTDYDLNQTSLFNSVMRPQLPFTLDRNNLSAVVHVPDLLPGIQFKPATPYVFFKLRFVLAIVSDLTWDIGGYKRVHSRPADFRVMAETDWQECDQPFVSEDFTLTLSNQHPLSDGQSLILFAGIEYGEANRLKLITPVDRKGCCKIMGLA